MPQKFLCALLVALPAFAQQASPRNVIGHVAIADARDVKFSGAVSVDEGTMAIGNGSAVTAAERTTQVTLTRGGTVDVCATTKVQMTQSASSVMLSLERGAVETHYAMQTTGASDVIQTPDLRVLISAPGLSDVRVRVNGRGDTCVENRGGADAPYVSVTPQLGDGLYRVASGQRVLFEHGDLRQVVDHEPDPCGCPPDMQPNPGEFPLAVSQGLTPAPPPPTKPVAAPGEVHAQVAATLVFDSQGASPRDSDNATAVVTNSTQQAPPPPVTPPPAQVVPAPVRQEKPNDVAHFIGRFFSRIFGKHRSVTS